MSSLPETVLVAVLVLTAGLCAIGLARQTRRGSPRVLAAEGNHLLMAVAMVVMALPVAADLVAPVVGVTVFALCAAGWVVALVAGRAGRPVLSPVAEPGCAANPVYLGLANVAMVAMYGAGPVRAAATPTAVGPTDTADMTGMAGMPGMAGMHAAGAPTPSGPVLVVFDVVVIALSLYLLARAGATVGALLAPRVRQPARVAVLVGAAGDTRPEDAPTAGGVDGGRVQLGCEALMAAAMAWMLLAML